MHLMQHGAAMTYVVVAHLALDASRMGSSSAAHAAAAGDFFQQRVAPVGQVLRGKWPQLAASFA